ncbi:acyl carrier protein [Streptomyces sp. NPDC054849]
MPDQTYTESDNSRIFSLISEQAGVPINRLRPENTFAELGLDSIALIELMVTLENAEGVQLPDELFGVTPSTSLAQASRTITDALKAASPQPTTTKRPRQA